MISLLTKLQFFIRYCLPDDHIKNKIRIHNLAFNIFFIGVSSLRLRPTDVGVDNGIKIVVIIDNCD